MCQDIFYESSPFARVSAAATRPEPYRLLSPRHPAHTHDDLRQTRLRLQGIAPPRLHGPYYQWTRKVDGKTVTVNLSAEQAKLLENWIAAGRELDRIVAEMERISLEATERQLRELPPPTRKAPVRRRRTQRDASG